MGRGTHGMTPSGKRFWFFISYSHEDRRHASRVQTGIERFRIPSSARMVGGDRLPARLGPVFRDRDVLAAAHDLTAEIRGALESSECLVVVCSAVAARSKWVAREVATFLELHGPERVCCVVIDGEKGGGALPEPLRGIDRAGMGLFLDASGGREAWRQVNMRIVAWAAGIPHERLLRSVQRRTARRVAIGAVAALGVAVGFGLLAARAEQSRRTAALEAERAVKTTRYLVLLLEEFLPSRGHGIPAESLLPLIDAAASPEQLAPLEQEPTALIRVRRLLATAYADLGKKETALALLQANEELAATIHGRNSAEATETRSALEAMGSSTTAQPE
jgi:hypothetical protein